MYIKRSHNKNYITEQEDFEYTWEIKNDDFIVYKNWRFTNLSLSSLHDHDWFFVKRNEPATCVWLKIFEQNYNVSSVKNLIFTNDVVYEIDSVAALLLVLDNIVFVPQNNWKITITIMLAPWEYDLTNKDLSVLLDFFSCEDFTLLIKWNEQVIIKLWNTSFGASGTWNIMFDGVVFNIVNNVQTRAKMFSLIEFKDCIFVIDENITNSIIIENFGNLRINWAGVLDLISKQNTLISSFLGGVCFVKGLLNGTIAYFLSSNKWGTSVIEEDADVVFGYLTTTVKSPIVANYWARVFVNWLQTMRITENEKANLPFIVDWIMIYNLTHKRYEYFRNNWWEILWAVA